MRCFTGSLTHETRHTAWWKKHAHHPCVDDDISCRSIEDQIFIINRDNLVTGARGISRMITSVYPAPGRARAPAKSTPRPFDHLLHQSAARPRSFRPAVRPTGWKPRKGLRCFAAGRSNCITCPLSPRIELHQLVRRSQRGSRPSIYRLYRLH